MNNYSNRKIIERIVTVKEWNKDSRPEDKIKKSYGYVMPIYHGYEWRRTKRELISKYTY